MLKNVTIGADPELIFRRYSDGKLINAVSVIKDFLGDNEKRGKFGCDGHRPTCELRPDPKDTPRELVNEVRNLMIQGYTKNPDTQCLGWYGGTYPSEKPLGGHVHIGNVFTINNDIRKLFDGLLGVITLLMEDPNEAKIRHGMLFNGYGQYGHLCIDDKEKRTKYASLKKADNGHGIEYKTMSSWMMSPGIALGIFAISKAIGIAITNNDLRHFNKYDWSLLEVDRKAFYDCRKEKFLSKLDELFKLMKKRFSYFNTSEKRFHEIKSLLKRKPLTLSQLKNKIKINDRRSLQFVLELMVNSSVIEYNKLTRKFSQGEYFIKINDSLPLHSFSGMKYWKNVLFLKQVIERFKIWKHGNDIKKQWGIEEKSNDKKYMSITSLEFFRSFVKKKENKEEEIPLYEENRNRGQYGTTTNGFTIQYRSTGRYRTGDDIE